MQMKSLFISLIATFFFGAITTSCKKDCIKSDRCNLEPNAGPCYAAIPKYYYDKEDKKCKQFIWGGCDGVVPFDTMEECEKQCDCK